MPAASGFDGIIKHSWQGREEFILLMKVSIFHDESDHHAVLGRDEHRNGIVKHPSKPDSAFIGNPHPEKHVLLISRCATQKCEKAKSLVVRVGCDVKPEAFGTQQKVTQFRQDDPRNRNEQVVAGFHLEIVTCFFGNFGEGGNIG
jgi:hypothetical protein